MKILILRKSGVSVANEEAVSPRPISTVDQAAIGSKVYRYSGLSMMV